MDRQETVRPVGDLAQMVPANGSSYGYHARLLHEHDRVEGAVCLCDPDDINIALNNRLMLVFVVPNIGRNASDSGCRMGPEVFVAIPQDTTC